MLRHFLFRFEDVTAYIPDGVYSVTNRHFVESRGDRSTVDNVLVLITDEFQADADTAITVCSNSKRHNIGKLEN